MFVEADIVLGVAITWIDNGSTKFTVKGLVVDSSAEPVIGANVLVEGTTNGTITDFEGLFTLQDVPSKANLVISFIGYKTQVIPVDGKKTLKLY